MSNPFKDLIRKTALKAQETFNIDEEKTQKFLDATNKVIDKTAETMDQVEQATNGFEGNLKQRLLRAKDAFVNSEADPAPFSKETPKEKASSSQAPKPVTSKSVSTKKAVKKTTKKSTTKKVQKP